LGGGAGRRWRGVFGRDEAPSPTADAALISSGAVNTITASRVRIGALNLALSMRLRIVAGLELGANIDVIGVGFGPSRTVNATTGNFQGPHTAGPPGYNLLALGRNDKGTLDSEFHLSYWFDERVVVRAGVSHLVTGLVPTGRWDDGSGRSGGVNPLFLGVVGSLFCPMRALAAGVMAPAAPAAAQPRSYRVGSGAEGSKLGGV